MSVLNMACSVLSFHSGSFCKVESVPWTVPSRTSRFRAVQFRNSIRCTAVSSTTADSTGKEVPGGIEKVELACPVCHRPVAGTGSQGFSLLTIQANSFSCQSCRKTYASKGGIIDLTIPTKDIAPLGSAFFQNPLIAFVYERGYRDAFGRSGFPGFDEEARRARDILEPARGGVIMDLSCGPGGFTRRFSASGEYDAVVASDFSEAMLEQCRAFLQSDSNVDLDKVVLVRADAARLPFVTSSLAGVHAGAAIHCWPNIPSSVAEISRVLRPGGVFVASTFLFATPPGLEEALEPVRQSIDRLQLTLKWFTEDSLRSVVESCGFVNWQCYRNGTYILFSASKPL